MKFNISVAFFIAKHLFAIVVSGGTKVSSSIQSQNVSLHCNNTLGLVLGR